MNGRTVLIGSCIVGSLVGLGFLVNYVYGKDPEKPDSKREENPSKKAEGQEQDSFNRKRNTVGKYRRSQSGKTHDERRQRNPEPQEKMVETKKIERPVAELVRPLADEFPLRYGSKGERVERLQVWLMRNYGWTGRISGVFDEKTEAQVKRFLKKPELNEKTYYKMKMGRPVYEQIVMR